MIFSLSIVNELCLFPDLCVRLSLRILTTKRSLRFSSVVFLDLGKNPRVQRSEHRCGGADRIIQKTESTCTSLYLRASCTRTRSKKEVFQPHLPVRLPCYDLAPITCFALGRSFRSRTSGAPDFHGLTGGVYKARERIHRAMADARLLANPASRSRVADSDPN